MMDIFGGVARGRRRPRPYVRTAGKKSGEKAGEIDESRSRRKLLRTETDETVRIRMVDEAEYEER